MKLKFFVTFLLLFTVIDYSRGQTKSEKEERVNASEFPILAQNVIAKLPKNCKHLKFFKETDGDKQSFETKFKYKKAYYSLEFSKHGVIEDIEILIKFKHIKDPVKTVLENYFKQSFKKHRFIKVQKQYVFNPEETPSEFLASIFSKSLKIDSNFEIIAEVTSHDGREIKEFTFNPNGSFIDSRVLSPMSYEHVLY